MLTTQPLNPEETIAAIASPAGRAARGIVRLSGLKTVQILEQFLQKATPAAQFQGRTAQQADFTYALGPSAAPLPIRVLLWPEARSYTGQPSAEIHTLGSPPILQTLLAEIYELGARPAQPGEFTLRSFLSGRLSLVQAEAVLGVIDARDDQQLDIALTQLAGGISLKMRRLRDQLLDDLADLEAGLDFVEEDIDFVNREEFQRRLILAVADLDELCEAADSRMVHQTAFRVVLAGLPNAGKSALFNRLTSGSALVSEQEGTTTDYLVGTVHRHGLEIEFRDTAGWEDRAGEISLSAQKHRQEEYEKADLVVWCMAAHLSDVAITQNQAHWQQLSRLSLPVWPLVTQWDRVAREQAANGPTLEMVLSLLLPDFQETSSVLPPLAVSAVQNEGLDEFWRRLENFLGENRSRSLELLGTTSARCRDALFKTREHLQTASQWATLGGGDELIAEEIRGALQELGLILGHVYTDDLLDLVFSKFCIGK